MFTEFTKKRVLGQLTLAVTSPAGRCHGRQKVSISECDLTGRRVMVDLLPVREIRLLFGESFTVILIFCEHKKVGLYNCIIRS